MGYGDIGALLKGATKSFDAGRDYSLAVAQAKQAASVRQQQLELQRQQQTFREEAAIQARKLTLDQFQFEKNVEAQKRKDFETEKKLAEEEMGRSREGLAESIALKRHPLPSGRQTTEQVATGTRPDVRQLGEPEALAREEEQFELLGAGNLTQTEGFVNELLNPNTAPARVKILKRIIYGKDTQKTGVNGVPTVDIVRVLNAIYPINRFGKRIGIPEGIDPNSFEFLQHGAELVKQGFGQESTPTGEPAPAGAGESDFERFKKKKKKQ